VSLITDDETGLAAAIAERLKAAGEKPLLLRHSTDVMKANGVVMADFTNPDALARAVQLVRQTHGPIGGILHLFPLRTATAAQNLAEWREMVQQDVKSLYALARAAEQDLKQTGPAGGALFAAATARGGAFGLRPDASVPPTHYAVADFVKTLALEFTGVRSKVIDLDPSDPLAILQEKLIGELALDDNVLQVGLPGDRRLGVMPRHAPLHAESAHPVASDWVILLTGGARGITAQVARALAERCHPVLILAGASPMPGEESPDTAGITEAGALKAALVARLRTRSAAVRPADVEAACQRLLKDRAIRGTLNNLRQAGSLVEYHALDVRDEAAFGGLIEHIYNTHGRLDAVIHGAGIIEDKLIRDKAPESFDRVLHTKADSAFLLHARLRPGSLKCLLLMSSVTAAFGNRGQSDYAAANGVLNGMAVVLADRWRARVVALNWGPWDSDSTGSRQTGMVTEETRRQFLVHGIQLVPPRAGVEAALRELEAGGPAEPIVVIGDGPWNPLALPEASARVQVAGNMP
jgi:NAD(P)-dependent dehydrogenase (short-subunit alcohol dehydrogenase family)